MSQLTVFADQDASVLLDTQDFATISRELSAEGLLFERWQADQVLSDDASQEQIISAYSASVERLKQLYGFQSVDVVSLTAAHPDKEALRQKFLSEHTHSEYEVRFFVDGQGLFSIHKDGKVFNVLCERGDLISVPANTRHWFDMGPNPHFKCIRLFTNPEGWVAQYTGDAIAERFPRLAN